MISAQNPASPPRAAIPPCPRCDEASSGWAGCHGSAAADQRSLGSGDGGISDDSTLKVAGRSHQRDPGNGPGGIDVLDIDRRHGRRHRYSRMQALQVTAAGGDSRVFAFGPRFDEETVCQLSAAQLSATNLPGRAGAAELICVRSLDNRRAKRIAEQAGEVDGHERALRWIPCAADPSRGRCRCVACIGEIPGESVIPRRCREPVPAGAQPVHVAAPWPWPAQRRALAPHVVSQQMEQRFATSPDNDRDSDLQQAR